MFLPPCWMLLTGVLEIEHQEPSPEGTHRSHVLWEGPSSSDDGRQDLMGGGGVRFKSSLKAARASSLVV